MQQFRLATKLAANPDAEPQWHALEKLRIAERVFMMFFAALKQLFPQSVGKPVFCASAEEISVRFTVHVSQPMINYGGDGSLSAGAYLVHTYNEVVTRNRELANKGSATAALPRIERTLLSAADVVLEMESVGGQVFLMDESGAYERIPGCSALDLAALTKAEVEERDISDAKVENARPEDPRRKQVLLELKVGPRTLFVRARLEGTPEAEGIRDIYWSKLKASCRIREVVGGNQPAEAISPVRLEVIDVPTQIDMLDDESAEA